MIVVDTNILAYLVIPGDKTEQAEATLLKCREWAAPFLWRSELRNVLSLYIKTGKLSIEAAFQSISDAEAVVSGRTYHVDNLRVLELAFESGCTAYDCEFVCLSEKLNVPLVTSDKKLLAAFPGPAISMQAFLES